MALKLDPPTAMVFSTDGGQLPERWKSWKETMKLYLDLSMNDKNEKEQCKAILYIIGEEGRKIHSTWSFTEEEKDKVDILLKKFEDYCSPRVNVTLERYRFNTMTQQPNETIDEFFTALKKISKNCKFGDLEDELLKDRIVVGVRSQSLKERMLREQDLKLEKALNICRAEEQSKTGLQVMESKGASNVDAFRQQGKKKHAQARNPCPKCGTMHNVGACPAFGTTCNKCKRPNHWAKVCRSSTRQGPDRRTVSQTEYKKTKKHVPRKGRTIHDIQEERTSSSEEESFNINCVQSKEDQREEIFTRIKARFPEKDAYTMKIRVKLDTGANANILTLRSFKQMYPDKVTDNDEIINAEFVDESSAKLIGYSGEPIEQIGTITAICGPEKKSQKFFVVKSDGPNILGIHACRDLDLIKINYEKGVHPDPKKCDNIKEKPAPTNVKELQQFLGMVQYMSPFIPKLSTLTDPLRKLLGKEREWQWTKSHEKAFQDIKNAIHTEVTLSYYDPRKVTVLEVDSSMVGIGAALIQEGKPIAFASKSMTETEARYANIERELLAVVFALERFHTYIYGKPVIVQSDHKPLENIQHKNLAKAPPRLQRMLLRIQPYNCTIQYKPGKEMIFADYLSRNSPNTAPEIELDKIVHQVSISEEKYKTLQEETAKDTTLNCLKSQIIQGWPEKVQDLPQAIKKYWTVRDYLSIEDGLILKNTAIIIPKSMQDYILLKLHEAHQGVEKCQLKARDNVFWIGMSKDIADKVKTCTICERYSREFLLQTILIESL